MIIFVALLRPPGRRHRDWQLRQWHSSNLEQPPTVTSAAGIISVASLRPPGRRHRDWQLRQWHSSHLVIKFGAADWHIRVGQYRRGLAGGLAARAAIRVNRHG